MAISKIKSNSIADDAITSDKVADGAVSAADVADGSLTNAKLADGTLTNAKVNASAAIDYSKLNLTGNIALADLSATGTKDATTFLRGDNTFAEAGGGIEVADQWRLTADKSINNTLSVIDANLEQVDTTGQGTLGTAMSESSGIFTFPSTGIYLVISNATFQNSNTSDSNYVFIEHQITTDNSTYTNSVESYVYFNIPTGTIYATATGIDMVDVTDTSNVKVRFRARSQSTCAVRAATDTSFTSFTFIRLGDT